MRPFLVALVLIMGTIPASAQWLDRKTPGIPRTPDGKPNLKAPAPRGPDGKIDLTGIWNGPVPEALADPANAQPWINDLVRQREQEYWKKRPSYQCLPSGPEADRAAGWGNSTTGSAGHHQAPICKAALAWSPGAFLA